MRLLTKFKKYSLIFLGTAGIVAVLASFKLQFLPQIQMGVMSAVVTFYLIWAIIYHYLDKSLKLEIVVEYVLTALLALVLVYGILL